MGRKVKVREHYRSLPGEGGSGNSSSSGDDGSSIEFIGLVFLFTFAVIALGWIWDLLVWVWSKMVICWHYCTDHWIIASIIVLVVLCIIGTLSDES